VIKEVRGTSVYVKKASSPDTPLESNQGLTVPAAIELGGMSRQC